MLLGAFLAAGMPLETLEVELRRLPMAEEFRLKVSSVKKNGIAATYVDVELLGATHGHCCEHGEGHDHAHEHSCEHDHGHANEGAVPAHEHSHEHHHRTMHDVRTILERSSLSAEVKEMSLKIFGVLAQAEGKVHGVRPEDVHFHEVGAVDSIVDIVGAAICLDYLEIEKIFVSRVNTGSGTVHTQHGRMMVPAPATAELLRLFPTYHEGAAKELTTPTGAAVLAALAEFSDHVPTDLLTECIAYGAGTWDLELPNVVRRVQGRRQARSLAHRDEHRRHGRAALRLCERAPLRPRCARCMDDAHLHEEKPPSAHAVCSRGGGQEGAVPFSALFRDDEHWHARATRR